MRCFGNKHKDTHLFSAEGYNEDKQRVNGGRRKKVDEKQHKK